MAKIKILKQPFKGVLILEPALFTDERGFFMESFQVHKYRDLGIIESFVQDNHSRSANRVLRGLHFTKKTPQAQILTVMQGNIFDVVVDVRPDSPTFGKWFGMELGDNCPRQIYMSHGFAHGFCVLSETADLNYKASAVYDSEDNCGIKWNDPAIGIDWPIINPIVSQRDLDHPTLAAADL
jgi:dTDP-4-dehydrorhamnose 3,5-epimerase